MQRYVGLLRGINVGGNGRLPMKSLIEICDGLGFESTRHYIQSGNIVFDTDTEPDPDQLSTTIQSAHGFAPKVIFIEAPKFENIASLNPIINDITENNYKFLQQYFLENTPDELPTEKIKVALANGERWSIRDGCFDLYSPNGVHNSKLAAGIERWLGVNATARNWKTILKILEMIKEY